MTKLILKYLYLSIKTFLLILRIIYYSVAISFFIALLAVSIYICIIFPIKNPIDGLLMYGATAGLVGLAAVVSFIWDKLEEGYNYLKDNYEDNYEENKNA